MDIAATPWNPLSHAMDVTSLESFARPEWVSAIQGYAEAPALSPDERSLYYHKRQGDHFVIYRVMR